MAHDIFLGQTTRDWSSGSLPRGTDYAPRNWWTESEAEADVQKNMKGGGLFGSKLSRKDAEESTIAFMKAKKIGITHPDPRTSSGSLLIPSKQQRAFLAKIDDIRYDLRLVSRRTSIGLGCLAGALGLLGIASIYRTGSGEKAKGYGQLNRVGR